MTTAALAEAGTVQCGQEGGLFPLPDVAGVPMWLTEGDDAAIVVVDAPHFGPELLEVLQYGPAWLRARVFHPLLTGAEQAWLDGLEQRDADELVPRVVAALEAELGVPLRVEADRALRAAEIVLEEGYVISTSHLFAAHGARFSHRARRVITAWLGEHAPD